MQNTEWLDEVQWDQNGLVPVVTQDADSKRILTHAWINRDALALTVQEGRAVYWSRSRQKLWRKGEESGNVQKLIDIHLDCDGDTVLYRVEQIGGIACHTGRESCFYLRLDGDHWQPVDPILKSPDELYGRKQD